jgi:hypothetical protein
MIDKGTRIVNQLLAHIHFDSQDPSVLRLSFGNIIVLLADNDIIVPQAMFEETLNKVLTERLVGKVPADLGTKHAVAQAILNTAYLLAVSKEDIIKHRIKTNQI